MEVYTTFMVQLFTAAFPNAQLTGLLESNLVPSFDIPSLLSEISINFLSNMLRIILAYSGHKYLRTHMNF